MTGCSAATQSATGATAAVRPAGNWAFSPASTASTGQWSVNVGFAVPQQAGTAVSAVARLAGAGCMSESANIPLSGKVGTRNAIALTSSAVDGSTLIIDGTLASDGKSITNATYSFKGGSCASLGSGAAVATAYAPISGTYTGNFIDAEGDQLPVTATLTQTSQPDANGQYHLSGSATFPNSACFASQPILTDSVVTGSNLSTTYTSTSSGETTTITAAGTFNSDATQLTITSWNVSGGLCDGEHGTGLLTEQATN